jgi:hypothetical protein
MGGGAVTNGGQAAAAAEDQGVLGFACARPACAPSCQPRDHRAWAKVQRTRRTRRVACLSSRRHANDRIGNNRRPLTTLGTAAGRRLMPRHSSVITPRYATVGKGRRL